MPELNMFTICSDIRPDESGVTRIITRGLEDILPMDQSHSLTSPPDESEWRTERDICRPYLNMVTEDMRDRLSNSQTLCPYVSPIYIDAGESAACRTLIGDGSTGAVPAACSLGLLSTSPASFTLSPHSGPAPGAPQATAEFTSEEAGQISTARTPSLAVFCQSPSMLSASSGAQDSPVDQFYDRAGDAEPTGGLESPSPADNVVVSAFASDRDTEMNTAAAASDSHKLLDTIEVALERLVSVTGTADPVSSSSASSSCFEPLEQPQEQETLARIANLLAFILNSNHPPTPPCPGSGLQAGSGLPLHRLLPPIASGDQQVPLSGVAGPPVAGGGTPMAVGRQLDSGGRFAALPPGAEPMQQHRQCHLSPSPLDTLADLALCHFGADSSTCRLEERAAWPATNSLSQQMARMLPTTAQYAGKPTEGNATALVQTLASIIMRLSEEPALAAALNTPHSRQYSSLAVPVTASTEGLSHSYPSGSDVGRGAQEAQAASAASSSPTNLISLLHRRSRSRSTPYQFGRFVLPDVGQQCASTSVHPHAAGQCVGGEHIDIGVQSQRRSSPLLLQISKSAPECPSVLYTLPAPPPTGPSLIVPPFIDNPDMPSLSSSSSAIGSHTKHHSASTVHSNQHAHPPVDSVGSGRSSAISATATAAGTAQHAYTRSEVKKCRKVYGVEHRDQWCNQCRWKKACRRFPDTKTTMTSSQLAASSLVPTQVPQQNRSTSTQSSSTPEPVGLDSPTDDGQTPSPHSGIAMSTSS